MRSIGATARAYPSGDTASPDAGNLSPAAKVALFLLATLALTWPAWLNGGPLLFYDSAGYLIQGRTAIQGVLALLDAPEAADGATEGAVRAAAASAEFVRSLGYAAFTYLSSLTPIGTFGVIVLQALLVAGVIGILVGEEIARRPAAGIAAAAAVVLLSPLAWFVSYLMPDILAAVPILCGLILVRGRGRMGWAAFLFLFGAATFAAISHYGHIGLALGVGVSAVLVLALQRRLTVLALALALLPPVLASGMNMLSSKVAFEEASVTPKRMPILLARSIEDGPARWYLETSCPTRRYAICEMFETIPDNVGALLWADQGLLRAATSEQRQRIRDEEMEILSRAFVAYPLQQTWSLTGNAVRQLFLVGTSDFRWGRFEQDADGRPHFVRGGREGLGAVAIAHILFTLAALAAICFYAWRDGLRVGRREREMLLILALGLLANAAIFGGLSAPVDRYQSRVVWLLPLFAALLTLARRPQPGRSAVAST